MRQQEKTRRTEFRTESLRAGPLSLSLSGCDLRRIVLDGREVTQRMYIAVRDRTWGTAPNRIVERAVERKDDGFRVRLNVQSVTELVDFAWSASIDGTADGSIDFSFEGVARRDFYRNRVGFCVLLPQEAAGAACRAGTSGAPQSPLLEGKLPLLISPYQPFRDLTSLSHEIESGVWLRLDFEGDAFEMEDQRNWTDASFKLYCTPLDLPFPVLIRKGDRIRQGVRLSLRDAAGAPLRDDRVSVRRSSFSPCKGRRPAPVVVRIGAPLSRTLCPIGLGAGEADAVVPGLCVLAATLSPAHLRVEADLDVEDWRQRVFRGSRLAREIGSPLWCLLTSSRGDAPSDLAEVLCSAPQPPAALLITRNTPPWNTQAALVSSVRAALSRAGCRPLIGGGTDAWFAELNRSWPETEGLDFVFYSATPQVHATDTASIIENLQGLASTVISAIALAGGSPVAVSTLSLAPRFNPSIPGQGVYPLGRDERRGADDPRQKQLFGAAWTLMSIKYLSEAGAWAITLDEIEGRRGLFSFGPTGGCIVHPVYYLLERLVPWKGAELLQVESEFPRCVDGLAVRSEHGSVVFLANLDEKERVIELKGLSGQSLRAESLSPYGWKVQPESDRFRLSPFSVVMSRRD